MRIFFALLVALLGFAAFPSATAVSTCDLNYILIGGGLQLTPFFNKDTHSYTVNVPSATTSVTFQAWQVDSIAYLDYSSGGAYTQYIGGGNPSGPVTLAATTTTVTIRVTCTDCQKVYTVTFTKPYVPPPPTGGFVIGDPQFTGLKGQNYQVHGVAGEVYNIISATDLQVNSKFVFLSSGECPVLNGIKAKGCFSHPGSYLGEIGLMTAAGDKIKLVSGSAKHGFASVMVNNKVLSVDETVTFIGGFISRNSTHLVTVQAGNFAFQFANSDMFINQRVTVLNWSALPGTHGLLGQTWNSKRYTGTVKEIEGEVEDYTVANRDLFGTTFIFNKFPRHE